jgi:outer membrane murein-binding lipoprotein Lpp
MDLAHDTAIGGLVDRARERRTASKLASLDAENDRLETEVRTLREQLDAERDDLRQALKAVPNKTKVKVKRRGGIVRTVVVAGTAYVLGTKAGRERYEQMKTWFQNMRNGTGSSNETWDPSMPSTSTTEMGRGKAGGTTGTANTPPA